MDRDAIMAMEAGREEEATYPDESYQEWWDREGQLWDYYRKAYPPDDWKPEARDWDYD